MKERTRWFVLAATLAGTLGLAWWAAGLVPGELGERGTGQILGTLLDPAGEPIADAELWLVEDTWHPATAQLWPLDSRYEQELFGPIRELRSNGRGRFCFSLVDPGTYWIGPAPAEPRVEGEVQRDGFAPVARRVILSERGEVVRLQLVGQRGLTIRGRVEGPGHAPVREGFVHGMHLETG